MKALIELGRVRLTGCLPVPDFRGIGEDRLDRKDRQPYARLYIKRETHSGRGKGYADYAAGEPVPETLMQRPIF